LQTVIAEKNNRIEDNNYRKWLKLLHQEFPSREAIFRLEFIRISDAQQEVNYSWEFNNLICVSTADGRYFIQSLWKEDKQKKYKEKQDWTSHLEEIIQNTSDVFTAKFISTILADGKKYVASRSYLEPLVTKFLRFLTFSEQNKILDLGFCDDESPENILNLDQRLHRKITLFLKDTLKEIYTTNPSESELSKIKPNESQGWLKYLQLLNTFESLYDDMDLTFGLVQEKGIPTLRFFQRKNNQLMHNFDSVGKGITEMLYFLYTLIIEEDQFIMFEEPEAHLHPHHQRMLYNLLQEHREHHQIVIITHSLYFIQPEDLFSLRIFEFIHDATRVLRLYPTISSRDFDLLRKNFNIRNRDALFADGIIFVEGMSEEWTFPYFFRMFGLDLDQNNLSLINIGGKSAFTAFLTFAQQFKKKYWFFFDYDVLGLAAGQEITPDIFKSSVIYKNRRAFAPDIRMLCESIIWENEYQPLSVIEFHEKLEYLRHLLQQEHIFIFTEDFENIFEASLGKTISFRGGKIDKAMQLLDFIREHEEQRYLPEQLYEFIELITEELKS
jgi:predicted ATP-dependent endonuclease of OLD family